MLMEPHVAPRHVMRMSLLLGLFDLNSGEDGLGFSGQVAGFEEPPFEVVEVEFGEAWFVKLAVDFCSGGWEDGRKEDGEVGAGLGSVTQDFANSGEQALVFFHRPGLAALKVAVAVGDVVVDGLEGNADLAVFHGGAVGCGGLCEGFAEGDVLLFRGVGGGDGGSASALEEVDGAVEEVSKVVGELGVEDHDEALDIEVAVLAGVDVAAEVVADGVGAELIGELVWVDDVAEGLGHFIAADVPESMD